MRVRPTPRRAPPVRRRLARAVESRLSRIHTANSTNNARPYDPLPLSLLLLLLLLVRTHVTATQKNVHLIAPLRVRDLSLGLHDEPTWSMRVTVDQRKILEAVARSRATGVLASELPSLFPKGSAAAKPQACHHLVKVLEFLGLLTSREIMRVTETKKTTVKKSQACVNKTTVLVLSWIARETGGDFGNDPDLDEIAHVGPKEREALTRTFVEMLRAAKDNVLMEAEFRAEVYKRLRKEEWEKGDDVGEGGLTGRRTGRLYLKIRAEMIAKGIVERMQCAIEGSDGGAGAIAECLRLLPEPLAIADGGAAAVAGEDASAGDVVDDDSLIGFGGEGKSSLARKWVDLLLAGEMEIGDRRLETQDTQSPISNLATSGRQSPPTGVFWW